MKISIAVPSKGEILRRTQVTPVARDGESWTKDCLGEFANMSGVYVHCAGATVLYVGKTTTGNYGTFGERLRREFQRKAAGNSHLYRLLLNQSSVRTAFIPLEEVRVRIPTKALSDEDAALLFERALIAALRPSGNRDSKR